MRRVVVTGIGALTAGGGDVEGSWQAVRDARDVFAPPSRLGERTVSVRRVGEVKGFDPARHFERKRLPTLDLATQFALVAAREAVAQSGFAFGAIDPHRTACIIGCGAAGEATHDESSDRIYSKGAERLPPLTVPRLMASAPASQIAMEFGIRGNVFLISSACASASHALGQAFREIRTGGADVAIAGGSEACLTFGCLKGWEALHVLSDDTCRPFSDGRRGVVLGEGAAMFVLESLEGARRRRAPVLGEILGFGRSSDAESLTSPSVAGMAAAMNGALADAGLDAERIDHVNAHGTGTTMNDVCESAALSAVLGSRLRSVPVTATKSVLGHSLGASGAIELAMTLLSLRDQVLAPTANFVAPDPRCEVDCIPNVARDARFNTVLSNSFAFGGLNASLLVARV